MDHQKLWDGRRWYALDAYLKNTFGEKVYKITLNGGMTCPNRDGHVGTGGCIFCSAKGSGDFAGSPALSISEQLAIGKAEVQKKRPVRSFIAYFQAFTNTYAPVDYLESIFMEAIKDPDVKVLSIATRPDSAQSDKARMGRAGSPDDPPGDSGIYPPGLSPERIRQRCPQPPPNQHICDRSYDPLSSRRDRGNDAQHNRLSEPL